MINGSLGRGFSASFMTARVRSSMVGSLPCAHASPAALRRDADALMNAEDIRAPDDELLPWVALLQHNQRLDFAVRALPIGERHRRRPGHHEALQQALRPAFRNRLSAAIDDDEIARPEGSRLVDLDACAVGDFGREAIADHVHAIPVGQDGEVVEDVAFLVEVRAGDDLGQSGGACPNDGVRHESRTAIVGDMIAPAQCRAARGLVDLSQQQLADAAKVGVVTVRQFESGSARPRNATAEVIQRALEAAGVIFVEENGEGPGVRLKKGAKEKGAK